MQQHELILNDDSPGAALYRRYAPGTFAYLYRETSSREDAEDILLEVFLAVLERENFLAASEKEQQAWIWKVARNKVADHYRRFARHPSVSLQQVMETLYENEDMAPEQVTLKQEEYVRLYATVKELSELQQEVLLLRFGHGLSCAEIAPILGKNTRSLQHVWGRLAQSKGYAQDSHQASAPSLPVDERAKGVPSSATQPVSSLPARRPHRYRALFQMLAAVLVVAALLGGFLVVFASRHQEPVGHAPIPTISVKGWQFIFSPSPGSTQNSLNGVAVVSASDIWAVGYSSNSPPSSNEPGGELLPTGERTLIEHWNGTQWSVIPSPNPGSNGSSLSAVAAISANDIWAVGSFSNHSLTIEGQAFPVEQTLIEHWNGTQWNIIPSPNPGSSGSFSLSAVAVISASDAWAVGSFFNGSITTEIGGQPILLAQTLIEHWNGIRWSVVSSSSPGSNYNDLAGVARVPGSSEIWVVGHTGYNYVPQQTITEVYSP